MRSARPYVLVAAALVALLAVWAGVMHADSGGAEPTLGAADRDAPGADALKKGGPLVAAGKRDWWSSKPSACTSCLQARCSNYMGSHPVLQNCGDAACLAPVNCAMDRRCFTNVMELPQCYCGPVGVDDCQKSDHVPTGACREAMERGLDTTDKAQVLERWVDEKYPAGRANRLLTCLSELCVAECVSKS
jgi:hypothetical protein